MGRGGAGTASPWQHLARHAPRCWDSQPRPRPWQSRAPFRECGAGGVASRPATDRTLGAPGLSVAVLLRGGSLPQRGHRLGASSRVPSGQGAGSAPTLSCLGSTGPLVVGSRLVAWPGGTFLPPEAGPRRLPREELCCQVCPHNAALSPHAFHALTP